MNRPRIIKESLEEMYGHSIVQVMHGMLSTLPILDVDDGEQENRYVVPQARSIQKAKEDFNLTFSFSVAGKILKSSDDIKFSLFTSTVDDSDLKRIFSSSVPADRRSKIVSGFEMKGELADLSFEEDTKLTLRVETIFNNRELIDMINEKLTSIDERPIDNNVIIGSVVARMLIKLEDE